MEITLNGIPISEEQCIGDSLPYINAAFLTLRDKIIESSDAIGTDFLRKTDFTGYFPLVGGTVYGGIQIGTNSGTEFNSGSVLRFGRTASTSDGNLVGNLPSIYCGTSNAIGNDLYVNANSANAKILLTTGTPTLKQNVLILDSAGRINAPIGNVCIGSTSAGAEKLEVVGGNVKITNSAAPALLLNNTSINSLQWNSKILFKSNNTDKFELGVDPTAAGQNTFYIKDSTASANRFVIQPEGYVYIPGNMGIGVVPDSNYKLKVQGDLLVSNSLTILGTFNTAGITSTGPISGTAISGTTGTFTGKVATINLESSGPVSGTTGTFTGKVTTNNLESSGPVSGTTATFTGKVTTINLESSGPVSGTTINANTGTYTGRLTAAGFDSLGPIAGTSISGTTGTFSSNLTAFGNIVANGSVSGSTGNFVTITGTSITALASIGADTGTFVNTVNSAYGTFTENITAKNIQTTRDIFSRNITASQDVTVTGNLTASSVKFTGDAIIGGATTISGAATIDGLTTINNNLTVTANISCDGDVIAFQTSDERLKTNITIIPDALDKVVELRGCEFEWNEILAQPHLKGKSAGVIAQDVEKVFPQAVTTREDGYKAVRYEYIIPLLIEAIKDLQDEIEDLKTKLNT